jgi:hypothetical protein
VAHINASDAQAWVEATKLPISTIDTNLEQQVANEVLGNLTETYGEFVPTWTDATNTPLIVRQVIAMIYTSWVYDRAYSEVETSGQNSSYGATLRRWAETLLQNIIRGSVSIAEISPDEPAVAPVFYPNDASDAIPAWATSWCHDESVGPAKFTIDKVF